MATNIDKNLIETEVTDESTESLNSQDSTPIIVNPSSSPQIGYSGEISVAIKVAGRTQKLGRFKNAGHLPLFNFIANCLAGHWAGNSFPSLLKVEGLTAGGGDPIASAWTRFSGVPVVELIKDENEDENEGVAQVTYHFVLPSTYLNGITHATKVVLAPKTATTSGSDLYATIDGLNLSLAINTSFTLLIDWTLTVTNQKTNKEN